MTAIRLGVPYVPRQRWAGGYQYFASLIASLRAEGAGRVTPVMLVPPGVPDEEREELARLAEGELFEDPGFATPAGGRIVRNLLSRSDPAASRGWRTARVDVILQVAAFHGWRPDPAVLAWIPDLQHRHLPQFFPRRRWWRRELGFRAQLRAADHLLVSSEAARQDIERWYPRYRGEITVAHFVPAPPDLARASSGAELREKYGLPERFIYMPNQLWGHKGHLVVAQALALLGPDAPVIVSTGATKDHRDPAVHDRLLGAIASGGVEKKYRLLGMIPREDVMGLLRAADALLNPSEFEGWSTTVEEAKMIHTPLLLSDIPVHREQAEGRARYFAVGDAASLAQQLVLVAATPSARGTDGGPGAWKEARAAFVRALTGAIRASVRRRAESAVQRGGGAE